MGDMINFVAGEAIGAFLLVAEDATKTRTAIVATAAHEPIGFSTAPAAAGDGVQMATKDGEVVRGIAGASPLTQGTRVTSGAAGVVIAAGAAEFSIGRVVEEDVAAGERVWVLIERTHTPA